MADDQFIAKLHADIKQVEGRFERDRKEIDSLRELYTRAESKYKSECSRSHNELNRIRWSQWVFGFLCGLLCALCAAFLIILTVHLHYV